MEAGRIQYIYWHRKIYKIFI